MTRDEIIASLQDTSWQELAEHADEVRRQRVGDEVHVRGIVEFSNYCCNACLYCGLRQPNNKVERYRMSCDEIVAEARRVYASGISTVVLQSGEDLAYSGESLAHVIRRIKYGCPGTAITLSVGERSKEDYKLWKDAGADRYLLRHETANPDLFSRLHPGRDLHARIEKLYQLRELGYQIGAGSLTGVPGQTYEDIADDIRFLQKLAPDMAGIGPFIPQADTPFSHYPAGDPGITLKTLALTRILTKNAHMPATTALETLLGVEHGQQWGLQAGCNVIMPSFTPDTHRAKYSIYNDRARVTLEKTVATIRKAGRTVAKDRGDSLKNKRDDS